MGHQDSPLADENCTTTGSFAGHGVEDGIDLIQETYARLGVDAIFEPNEAFFDRLESAFIWAYLGSVRGTAVPEHVLDAIDDARALTMHAYGDDPDAALRTDVIPTFYKHVAAFHCAYHA